jgi:hypothetical protein
MENIGPNHKENQFFFASPYVTKPYGSDLCKNIRTQLGHAWAPLTFSQNVISRPLSNKYIQNDHTASTVLED